MMKKEDIYYYNNYNYNKAHNQLDPRVVQATTALITGMIGLALCFTVYISSVLGGISVLLAVLSRDIRGKLLPQARRALIFGILAIIASYYLLVKSFVFVTTDPAARAYMNETLESTTGVSFDDMLSELGIEIQQ